MALEQRLPWISWEAIDYIDSHLSRAARVFEYGSGGSTLFLAERCQHLTSVENARDWHASVRGILEAEQVSNVTYLLREFDPTNPAIEEPNEYISTLDGEYDCILIDGIEERRTRSYRRRCFARAESHIAPGGMIVLDDAWRYDDPPIRSRAKKVVRHQSIGPGRVGVTRTDIYHY